MFRSLAARLMSWFLYDIAIRGVLAPVVDTLNAHLWWTHWRRTCGGHTEYAITCGGRTESAPVGDTMKRAHRTARRATVLHLTYLL